MRPIALAACALTLALATAAAPVHADDAADVATRWGLLGVWKADCARGPSRADVAVRYIVRDGRLWQERDDGNAIESNVVSHAERTGDGMLELTVVVAPPGQAQTFVLKREKDGQFLVWSNRSIGSDRYTIRDGKFTDGNGARPLLTQCSRYGGN
jgi:uncharacterized membrane protein